MTTYTSSSLTTDAHLQDARKGEQLEVLLAVTLVSRQPNVHRAIMREWRDGEGRGITQGDGHPLFAPRVPALIQG